MDIVRAYAKWLAKQIKESLMACKCKNEDGSLSSRCMGTCVEREMCRQSAEIQERDPLNAFREEMLGRMHEILEDRMKDFKLDFQKQQIDLYKTAFLEGIKEGLAIGQDIYV
jgi:hypothetical protein